MVDAYRAGVLLDMFEVRSLTDIKIKYICKCGEVMRNLNFFVLCDSCLVALAPELRTPDRCTIEYV